MKKRKPHSSWEIPDGDAYKRAEKMFYYKQLGMTYREIGLKFGITADRVRQIFSDRKMAVAEYLRSKELEEQRLCLK